MKRLLRFNFLPTTFFLLTVVFLFSSCRPEEVEPIYTAYTPVFMKKTELDEAIIWKDARALDKVGKIYVYDNFLLINEWYYGVHVFDNTDPKNPVNIGFIQIPGNVEIGIKQGTLYANNSVDLVTLELQQNSVVVLDRIPDVFDELPTPDGLDIPQEYSQYVEEGFVIVSWKK